MHRLLPLLLAFLLVGCPAPIYVPIPPVPPAPVPPGPTPPPPNPTPVPPKPTDIALTAWDAVTVGMTEDQVVGVAGASSHRSIVGSGTVVLGYYVTFPADSATPGRRYVEAAFGTDGKIGSKNVW